MRRGFTLVEVLASLALLGLILLVASRASLNFIRENRAYTVRENLLAEADLLAMVLRREASWAGYRTPQGGLEVALEAEGDALRLRYLCEGDLLKACGPAEEGKVRLSAYRLSGGLLQYGACLEPGGCASGSPPAWGRASGYRAEAFRVAFARGGTWQRGNLVSDRQSAPAEALAVYFRLATPDPVGAPPFAVGSGVVWGGGLSPATFGLSTASLDDGRARAERLVVLELFNTH